MRKKIDLAGIYVPSEDVAVREIAGELILVRLDGCVQDQEGEDIFTLNQAGQVVWGVLDGQTSLRAIAKELCSHFNVSAKEATRDVTKFIEDLQEKGFIRCVPP